MSQWKTEVFGELSEAFCERKPLGFEDQNNVAIP